MANRVQNIFGATKKELSKIENKDGFPAYTLPLKEQYVQMLMTNTLGNTFYASSDELVNESKTLHDTMVNKDPLFMAKAILYARNNGYMRLQPIMGLVYLITKDAKLGEKVFNSVIKTPNDLKSFVTLLPLVRTGRGLGRAVSRNIKNYLNNLSEYHVIKYGGTPKPKLKCNKCGHTTVLTKNIVPGSRCSECYRGNLELQTYWGLRDILRAVRPTPVDDAHAKMFRYLVHGFENFSVLDNLYQVKAYETLKYLTERFSNNEMTNEEYVKDATRLIEIGRLPHEVVTGVVKPSTELWTYIMRQMPLFALLRNLNTLDRHDVFNNPENVSYVAERLVNEEAIRRVMIWPNRIASAYNMFNGSSVIKDALRDMADISLGNVPNIAGKNIVFLDVSESMTREYKMHGAMLGLAVLKFSSDSAFWCFGSRLHYPDISLRKSILTNMDRLTGIHGGGTSTGHCLRHLLGNTKYSHIYDRSVNESRYNTSPQFVDNIIIFTDEQQNSGAPVIKLFREYKKSVNPNVKMFIINVAPYETHIAPKEEVGIYHIFGWSDEVLRYISSVINGFDGQVESVENMEL